MAATKKITYAHQDDLPSLPLPSLEDTLAKLLRSTKPFLTAEEFEHTEAVIEDFKNGVGRELHAILEDRAASSRNWIEEWWETFAYMQPRYPIAVNINYHGVLPGGFVKPFLQTEGAAIFTNHIARFQKAMADETVEPEMLAGQPLCMYQYSRMFNSCRIPGVDCDEFRVFDSFSRHICVLRSNCIYKVDIYDESGAPIGIPELTVQFERVMEDAASNFEFKKEPAVSVLTSDNRTTWAKNREYMIELDPKNKDSLDTIERALFMVTLTTETPETTEEVARQNLLGDGRNIWYDKPFHMVVHANGRGGTNGEHAWADAMVVVKMYDEVLRSVDEELRSKGLPKTVDPATVKARPQKLTWALDDRCIQSIEASSTNVATLIKTVELNALEFKHYGKGFMKRYGLIPDFYVQMAIQLAYHRLHKRFVATYESAHTRLFYHGRTETIRTTSIESCDFVNSIQDPTQDDATRFEKLKTAISSHKSRVKDAVMAQGVDRHMMGLLIVSEMMGKTPKPAIFTDKGFLTSKKYILSTSNVSMSSSTFFGGFSPMYTDGYGVCYAIQESMLKFSITANNDCPETSAAAFRMALDQALIDMQRVCMTRNVIYVGSKPTSAAGGDGSKM